MHKAAHWKNHGVETRSAPPQQAAASCVSTPTPRPSAKARLPSNTKRPRKGAWRNLALACLKLLPLAVAGDGAYLSRQEMVRRPRTSHDHLAILELLGGRAVTVLIFFDRLGVDEVGDFEQHAFGIDLFAVAFFFMRIAELVHLDRYGAGFGLAFALPASL